MEKFVSVIIPTFNRAAFLGEAVASVTAQTGVAMEVIVIDDGSTDDTASVLSGFGSALRCIHQPNRGVSAARNAGIHAAKGEWLAFLDSDDLWLPEKLEAQLDYLSHHSDLRICQTEEVWLRNGQHLNPKKYHRKPQGHCFSRLLERCLVSPSAVMIHRTIFEEVGPFDETLPACEDYDMWLRIGCRHPIGLVPRPLVIKRGGHPDQLSATVPSLDYYRIQSLTKLLRESPLTPAQRLQAVTTLREKCRIYGEGCRKRGNTKEADFILSLPHIPCYGLQPEG